MSHTGSISDTTTVSTVKTVFRIMCITFMSDPYGTFLNGSLVLIKVLLRNDECNKVSLRTMVAEMVLILKALLTSQAPTRRTPFPVTA